MKKFTSFQVKLILTLCIILMIVAGLFYNMLYSMNTIYGKLHTSAPKKEDKFYTYNIYSDFYFNISKYNEKGEQTAYFSQLIPIKSSIGFDFSGKTKLTINQSDSPGLLSLSDKNSRVLNNDITRIKEFGKEYGQISTIQDEDLFNKNVKITKETIQRLYNLEIDLPLESINSQYEQAISVGISNLTIKPIKFKEINENSNGILVQQCKDIWCSELVKWKFGEDDSITLEYVAENKEKDLEQFLNEQKKNLTMIKIAKIYKQKNSNLFILIPDNTNQIMSYFMDNNGYIYVLKYKYKNPSSRDKYQNDFIKIAYGINFIDVKNFENKYVQIHKKLNTTKEKLMKINQLDIELTQYDIYRYYNLSKNSNLAKNMSLEDIFTMYKNNNNFITTIEKEYNDKLLIKEAIEKIPSISTFFVDSKAKEVKEKCDNLECIKKLKENNWK